MENKESIGFNLAGIRTDQFALVDPTYETNQNLAISINFNVNKDDNQRIVAVTLLVHFTFETKPIVVIQVSCFFKIADDSWESFKVEDSNALVIPSGFITHLAVLTVGTARGILHAKTEGTKFNTILLPTLNIMEVFKTDLRIE